MLSPDITVNPETPYIDGGVTLDEYVARAALRGTLGLINAERLYIFADKHLSDDTLGLLENIVDPTDVKDASKACFQYPVSDAPEQSEACFVAPLLRVGSDIEVGDKYTFDVEGERKTRRAWAIDAFTSRGTVTFQDTRGKYTFLAEHPALIPTSLDDTLARIHNIPNAPASIKRNAGRVFFELSYFDPRAGDEQFRHIIQNAMAQYGMTST